MRRKRRREEREAEACLEHPGGGGPRWRPRSVVSRFLFLSVSFSQLNSRYRQPTLTSLPFFGARYAHGIRNAARDIRT